MRFANRQEAGQKLADRLVEYREMNPVVLALPRGGVPVAAEVAATLQAPLDVLVARKIGAPGQPELGIGAIAEGDARVIDEHTTGFLRLGGDELESKIAEEQKELARRVRDYRGDRALPSLSGRTVLLVDDGLATGVSARAAVRALRGLDAGHIVVAVPVCPPATAEQMRSEADEVIALDTPADFAAVGQWYVDFAQTTDREVIDLLEQHRKATNGETVR